jgi:uncharacterized membrane protein YfcA
MILGGIVVGVGSVSGNSIMMVVGICLIVLSIYFSLKAWRSEAKQEKREKRKDERPWHLK